MVSVVSLSKSKLFTRVALVSFVQHSCCTRVVRIALLFHSCCTRVSLMLHLCHSHCTLVVRVALMSLVSGTRDIKQTRSYVCSSLSYFRAINTFFIVGQSRQGSCKEKLSEEDDINNLRQCSYSFFKYQWLKKNTLLNFPSEQPQITIQRKK